ncbi:type IV pilus secretin PilQ family protein [Pseudoalteromonas sp. McH1-7]|uniref:Type IV pilus assembly protein PilQ n=1 Tax=Pseudoalteromonas peptidolytica F12-50-A1 TaxID=1315280 RepID=A0A8I0T6D3_9GAMM|nr:MULTISPECIES: type IV pilus secretin PilQ family protein [Pseudoalteromonas]NUZ10538.1 type IV pilus secretin PilQ family protein [Pseudoalteromonas sp. McH1-7]MBE0347104.1 type IV pilus assembly protein PilQ [Pseudoalteromonas peptidolytica F12-50-A1]MDW7549249.1 type IV pilus secretin PilQ family protein [Pseudoalteromonas peptidolytica]NLR15973.1 type IV pilus secretin PilQ family protein [Pseudoalteromonas peptidolytica]RRS08758.1 type IV pilus secretin PilQ family protein [Pseudoaltero
MNTNNNQRTLTYRGTRTIIQSVLGAAFVGLSSIAQAIPMLYDIRYNPVPTGETQLQLVFDEKLSGEPSVSVNGENTSLELFFQQAEFEESLKMLEINKAGIKGITSQLRDGGFTVAINMDELKLYKTEVKNNLVIVEVSGQPIVSEQDQSEKVTSFINQIQAIDFRRGEQGEGKILAFLEHNQAAIDVQERGGKIIADFHHIDIAEDLLYELDVLDFGTVVSRIETFKEENKSRIVIEPNAAFKFSYQQLDNIFTLAVEKDEGNKTFGDQKEYKGQPITLNFQDIPIRSVLQIIADTNNFNLVTSDTVSGNITLRLDGVPWDQALDVVLRVKGLDKRMDGSILMVAPSEELAAREAKELQARQQVEELEPLYSEYIQLNYAKAEEFADLLKTDINSIISHRGSVSVDKRTNTLLIKDTSRSIESIRRMVETLDVPVKQVRIESRMVTVDDTVQEDLGVRWGFSDQQGSDAISGTLEGANSLSNGIIPSLDNRLNVNLGVKGVPAGSIGMHIAKLADGTLIDLELSALEQENKGEIIATPSITTANQKKARIEQGTEIPYVEASSSGATTVSFKKAVLSLEVTPQITPDNKIILDLVITQDTKGDTVQTPNGPATAINTQEIQTQVLVENGQTIVLGGIYQQEVKTAVSKIPVLGDIPYLGLLFKNSRDINEKRELLIFVTPKIIQDSL